jgi:hypothetical protein
MYQNLSNNPAVLAAVVGAYFVLGRLGLAAGGLSEASALWPASGFALAAMLLFGRGVWSAIFVGAFIEHTARRADAASAGRHDSQPKPSSARRSWTARRLSQFKRFDPIFDCRHQHLHQRRSCDTGPLRRFMGFAPQVCLSPQDGLHLCDPRRRIHRLWATADRSRHLASLEGVALRR